MKKKLSHLTALVFCLVLLAGLAPAALAAEPSTWLTADLSEYIVRAGGLRSLPAEPERAELLDAAQEAKRQAIYDMLYEGLSLAWNLDGSQTPEVGPGCVLDFTELGLAWSDMDTPGTDLYLFWQTVVQVLNEHGELFYVSGQISYQNSAEYPDRLGLVRFSYYEGFAEGDKERFDGTVDAAVQELGLEDPARSDVEKLLAIHDYLIARVTYDADVAAGGQPASQTVYSAWGALMERDAVCQGYSEAFLVLSARAGIDCRVLSAPEMNHAWNLAKVDGAWYHVDVTWDDWDISGFCGYDHFLRSTQWMAAEDGGGHYGWDDADLMTPEGGEEYADGWAFNGQNFSVHRAEDGEYYYYNAAQDALVKGPLRLSAQTPAAVIGENLGQALFSGAVWVEDCFYYLKDEGYPDLTSGVEYVSLYRLDASAGTDLFVKSMDGSYRVLEGDETSYGTREPLELEYDAEGRSIWLYGTKGTDGAPAFSSQWRSDASTAVVETAPVLWCYPDGAAEIAPVAGIFCAEPIESSVMLVSAWYQEGRFLGARLGGAVDGGLAKGCHYLLLPEDLTLSSGEYQRKLFLLSGDGRFIPLAEILDAQETVGGV